MQKSVIATAVVVGFLIGVFAVPTIVDAQMGYGRHHGQQWGPGYERRGDWNYCPYCGRNFQGEEGYGYGMGPGMRGRGYGMGPGMMGRGYGHMYDDPRGPYYGQPREPLKKEDVKTRIENMLEYSRNPNLKVGKIEDKGVYFEAEITTKDGSLVDKLLVDKDTGRMRSVY
jgi:hypothetical protein